MSLMQDVIAAATEIDKHWDFLKNGDWRLKIDEETLNLADCENCVLGQVFGCYTTAPGELKLSDELLPAFCGNVSFHTAEGKRTFENYRRAWVTYVRDWKTLSA